MEILWYLENTVSVNKSKSKLPRRRHSCPDEHYQSPYSPKAYEWWLTCFGIETHIAQALISATQPHQINQTHDRYANILTPNASGVPGHRRMELYQQQHKYPARHYKPLLKNGHFQWGENFNFSCTHISPGASPVHVSEQSLSSFTSSRPVEPLRSVPHVLQSICLDANRLETDKLKSIVKQIHVEGVEEPSDDFENSAQYQALGNALGRHMEGVADATLEMVFEFLDPYLEILECTSTAPASEEKQEERKETSDAEEDTRTPNHSSKTGYAEDSAYFRHRRVPVVEKAVRVYRGEEAAAKRRRVELAKDKVTWEHVLTAVQSVADSMIERPQPQQEQEVDGDAELEELMEEEHASVSRRIRNQHEVSPSLPLLELSPAVTQRIQSRLLSLFGTSRNLPRNHYTAVDRFELDACTPGPPRSVESSSTS
eukprot:CAMPEP_0185041848 /NCGR_PEP_ID=MMETSP1103-20130426/41680_1 /TAXON_ID=36769 /ORGANISM="Paraphysomonas bandaiensis, Strain Caron Lab Isolate" /LENGTH=427 /DNA_ID=CAMNT_0027581775 /DNA_START=54 /DNA_END=1337 /DNA_ORIENTATION=-